MKTTKITKQCLSCGGDLVYDPTQKTLVCKQCGSLVPVVNVNSTEKSFQSLLSKVPTWQKDAVVFRCDHCGAKSVFSKLDMVAKCDYCGATDIVKTAELPGVRPDTIVVFGLSQTEAVKQIQTWLSKRPFIPDQFKCYSDEKQLHGIYFPAFTFDADSFTKYTGVEVLTKTFTVSIDGKDVIQTRTIRRPVEGVEMHTFDDLLVLSNQELTPKVLKSLEPFDTNHGQVFQQAFLAGFTVCQTSKEPLDCWNEAKTEMEKIVRNKINAKFTEGTIENLQIEFGVTNVGYKYVLLPVYVGHTEYKRERYQLFVNGQTGKVYGKTPKSKWKIFSFFATMGLLLLGVGIILARFL